MFLQNIRKTIRASILAMARQGIFFLPIVFILPKIIGLRGIQIAQPMVDFLTLCLSIPFAANVLKEMKN